MIEKELWGTISFDHFNKKFEDLSTLFGKPKESKRLALRFGPNERMYINTRIRITDGQAKLMQKVHERKDNVADENELDIPNDTEYILNLFNTFKNLLKDFENTHFYLIRFENYIFKTPDFEIKLTHQIGNEDIYSFEVEALTENADLKKFCRDTNLEYEPNPTDEFWVEYNKKVNVDIADWSDQKLREILLFYLN